MSFNLPLLAIHNEFFVSIGNEFVASKQQTSFHSRPDAACGTRYCQLAHLMVSPVALVHQRPHTYWSEASREHSK